MQTKETLLSVDDLMDLIQVSRGMVYKLLSENAIPKPIRFGSLPRWRASEIEEWIKAKKAG